METRSYNLGIMSEKGKNNLVKALHGKTYMNFDVQWGINPGGFDVHLQTTHGTEPDRDIDTSDEEILAFALYVLAEDTA